MSRIVQAAGPFIAAATVGACVFGASDEPAEEALQCVLGAAAVNPVATLQNGSSVVQPVTMEFSTIAEAERFLCLEIPDPKDIDAWQLQYVFATRPQSIDAYAAGDGIGNRRLMVNYRHDSLDGGIEITIHSTGTNNPSAEDAREVRLQGVSAGLIEADGQFCYSWEADGLGFSACGGGVTAADALPLLESME